MDTVYLDTETTGLSPDRGDRVVDIAMVDDLGNTVIDTLVDPERPIPAEASRLVPSCRIDGKVISAVEIPMIATSTVNPRVRKRAWVSTLRVA